LVWGNLHYILGIKIEKRKMDFLVLFGFNFLPLFGDWIYSKIKKEKFDLFIGDLSLRVLLLIYLMFKCLRYRYYKERK
jgi:hypothetical protein